MLPVFDTKLKTADENDIYSYGFAFTSSDLDAAVKSLSDIMPYIFASCRGRKVVPAYVRRNRKDKTPSKCA